MNDPGHNYRFGGPAKTGWPSFGPDGKIVREAHAADGWETCRSPASVDKACVKMCGERCRWAEAD